MNTGIYDEDGNEIWCAKEEEHKLYKAMGATCPCADVYYHVCHYCDARAAEYSGRANAYWCNRCHHWWTNHESL